MSVAAEDALPGLSWRPMTPDDLDMASTIEALAFPVHFEGREYLANRLALHPGGCFVLADGEAAPVGYLIAYPWRSDAPPVLRTLIAAIPEDARLVYLQDMALRPEARHAGHSRAVVQRVVDDARAAGWPAVALIAIDGTSTFWGRHGFVVRETPELSARLAGYGADARYMVRPL